MTKSIAIFCILLFLNACSSSDNSTTDVAMPVTFSGTPEDQARTCTAVSNTAPEQTTVRYVGNIWREEVDTDEAFAQLWNQVTPENAGKWGQVEATRNTMQWDRLDNASAYAANNAMAYKFHTLVWGGQQPGWISSLSADEQRIEIDQWIDLLAQRFPNVEQIDVVNEPLHSTPSYIAGLEIPGNTSPWSWVINTFAKARQRFPNSELLLNDFNILRSDENTAEYLEIVGLLQAEGLIDGIGLQAHFLENTNKDIIIRNLNKLGATGLPIYLSEFDLNIEDDQLQLDKLQEIFPIFYTSAFVQGITFWGFRQGQIWQEHSHLINENGIKRPAMKWLECYLKGTAHVLD